ncbi:MAG: hypothetical protein ACOCX9_03795 [Spirochaetota bacterium]
MKKKLKIIGITIAATLVLLFICLTIVTMTTSYRGVIKKTEGSFYNAKHIVLLGSMVLCMEGDRVHTSRKSAFSSENEDYSPSLINLSEILLIEFAFEDEEIASDIPSEYLGTYQVNVSGHKGYLYLAVKKGRLYGGFRFPNWAKGVYEPLKRVRIYNGKISFIRSITNRKDLQRVGANTYFTQYFYGNFKNNGKLIVGNFTHRGAKNYWEGFK